MFKMQSRSFLLFAIIFCSAFLVQESKSAVNNVWQSAMDFCALQGMKLVDISTSDKDLELLTLLEANGLGDSYIWSCGKKVGDAFVWTELNNTPFSYTRWYAGEPNDASTEICVHFQSNHGWFDTGCQVNSLTLCQPA
ncbi:hypothetical protein B566_EDAN006113 [Ephemera danica]|nr:hypothetical protein B566_EDAN006113 [Ephemera danica]